MFSCSEALVAFFMYVILVSLLFIMSACLFSMHAHEFQLITGIAFVGLRVLCGGEQNEPLLLFASGIYHVEKAVELGSRFLNLYRNCM